MIVRGSIKKLGTNKWKLKWDRAPKMVNGKLKRDQGSLVFNGTKSEAEAKLAELVAEANTGVSAKNKNMTVKELLEYWYEATKNTVGYRTKCSYDETIKLHLVPNFGGYKLIDLEPSMIQKYCNDMDGKLSNTTIAYHYRVLKMALLFAVGQKLIRSNPADGVKPPSKTEYEGILLAPSQIKYVLDNTKDTIMYMPIALAAFLGLRRGEICALTWDNVDLENNVVRIAHSLSREDGKLNVGKTKTNRIRYVAIGPELSKILTDYLKTQKTWNDAAGIERKFVCCWEDGRPLDPHYVSKKYREILTKLKLDSKSRFHDLRHNFVTSLLNSKVNPKIISEMTGHVIPEHILNATTFQTYSHVDVEMQRDAAQYIEDSYLN